MRRDVMEQAGLAGFAEVGLIIFVIVFIAIFLRAMLMRREQVQACAHLPFEGDEEANEALQPNDEAHLQEVHS